MGNSLVTSNALLLQIVWRLNGNLLYFLYYSMHVLDSVMCRIYFKWKYDIHWLFYFHIKLTDRHTIFHAMLVKRNQQGLPRLKTKYLLEVADEQKRNNTVPLLCSTDLCIGKVQPNWLTSWFKVDFLYMKQLSWAWGLSRAGVSR